MSVQEIKNKIEELKGMRSRRRRWLGGTSLGALGITTVCLLIARNAAVGLLQDGPTHDEFVADLTHQISKQVLPQMDGFDIQASYGRLPLPDTASPISHHPKARTSEEKTVVGVCGAADDPQKPLGRFREQTVSEYQTTVTKIVSDLAAIRGREGKDAHAGLSAGAVASLFVSHVQEELPKPSLESYRPPVDVNSSKDAR